MLPIQFFGQNAHFAINLFAALVFFAVFWLNFDAWLTKKNHKEFIRWFSFLVVAISFVVSATVIEQAVTGRTRLGNISDTLAQIMRLIGYVGIIIAQLIDPLQEVPKLKGITEEEFASAKPVENIQSNGPVQPAAEQLVTAQKEVVEKQPPEAIEMNDNPEPPHESAKADGAEPLNIFGPPPVEKPVTTTEAAIAPLPAAVTSEASTTVPPRIIKKSIPIMDAAPDDTPPPPSPKKTAKKVVKKSSRTKKTPAGFAGVGHFWYAALPVASLVITILYWRRATRGLERHYKKVALAFGLLTVAETLSLAHLWQDTNNPVLAQSLAAFGPVWTTEQVFLLAAVLVLGKWVWGYLTNRFMSQLFMIFTALTIAIFLLTTMSFTYLLVNNVQKASLDNLRAAANVLNYAIEGKKSETLANTQAVAENPDIATAVQANNHQALNTITRSYLKEKKLTSLIVTNASGQVLLRAEDANRYGDSQSSDTMIRRALIGQTNSSIALKQGVLAPLVYIKSAVPIRDASGHIVGSAVASLIADNAFLDGIKKDTGLDSAIYANDVRSATTFVAPDGSSRWVGVKETNAAVQKTVLHDKKIYQGTLTIQNRHFLAVYAPLKDVDNTVVGMLFVGRSQATILQTAGHSVELTFIVTAVLLALVILPAYAIAKYLAYQLD